MLVLLFLVNIKACGHSSNEQYAVLLQPKNCTAKYNQRRPQNLVQIAMFI